MRRLSRSATLVALSFLVLAASSSARERGEVALRVPDFAWTGDRVRMTLVSPRGMALIVTGPSGRVLSLEPSRVGRGRWAARFRAGEAGLWRVRIPGTGIRTSVVVRRITPLPPAGFATLGRKGCDPPSPAVYGEAFGTAVRGRLWALLSWAGPASATRAVIRPAPGEPTKLVFRWADAAYPRSQGRAFPIVAIDPEGKRRRPVWGPERHQGSSWRRPGREWGTGWAFDRAGCWTIRVGSGRSYADLWLRIER